MGRSWKTGPAELAVARTMGIFDAVDIGILILDSASRPCRANRRFFEIWRIPADLPDAVRTVDEVLAHGGIGDDSSASLDDWIAFATGHASALRLGFVHAESLRLPNGTIVLCGQAAAPNGGSVITYTDITQAVGREVDEALIRLDAELRFRGEIMETHATGLASLAEAADESARRVEEARRELEREIAERRELEAKLRVLATTDGLTGALNRAAWFAACQRELDGAQDAAGNLAVLMIDVDFFKSINDRYGHPGGDAALRRLVAVLRSEIRRGDLLGRLGGEEFAIGLPGIIPEQAEAIAERLVAKVADSPVAFEGRSIHLTVSIGIAFAGRRELAIDQVLGRADIALYRAKGSGRNRAVFDRRADAA